MKAADAAPRRSNNPVLEAALQYAGRGWHVFPACIVGTTKKSHKAKKYSGTNWGSTTDTNQIIDDFRKWPHVLGIVTGAISGIFVVEADTKEGHDVDGLASLAELQRKHGPLPPTLEAESTTGSIHRYFVHPGGVYIKNTTSELAPGVDVRGDGGMVIAPPSLRDGKRYRWRNNLPVANAPAWLLALVTEQRSTIIVDNNVISIRTGEPLDPDLMAEASKHAGLGLSVDPADYPPPEPAGKLDAALIAAAKAPNPSLGWEEWNNRGMMFFAASGGSEKARGAWHLFSRQSPKYSAANTDERWAHYHQHPPTKYTVASVYMLADEGDPEWRDKLQNAEQAKSNEHIEIDDPEPASSSDQSNQSDDPKTDPEDNGSWWRDPKDIPPRPFLHGTHYQRKTVGATMADGGRAKTTKLIYEAVSMVLGHDPMTGEVHNIGPLRVAVLNGEENQDELDRRVAAICVRYEITKGQLGGRLFVRSLKHKPAIRYLATTGKRGGVVLNEANINRLIEYVKMRRIDVLIIDPLVKFHGVPESDNVAMDSMVTNAFGRISEATGVGLHVELSHHTRKLGPGQVEATVDDGRGASAVKDAVRSARVLNFMTLSEAQLLGITEKDRRLYVRTSNGKTNVGPIGTAEWSKLEVVHLPNGDYVAVAEPWKPDAFADVTLDDKATAVRLAEGGKYRADPRSPDWFGYVLAKPLGMEVHYGKGRSNEKHLADLKTIINTWIRNGILAVDRMFNDEYKSKDYIVPGPKAEEVRRPADDSLDVEKEQDEAEHEKQQAEKAATTKELAEQKAGKRQTTKRARMKKRETKRLDKMQQDAAGKPAWKNDPGVADEVRRLTVDEMAQYRRKDRTAPSSDDEV